MPTQEKKRQFLARDTEDAEISTLLHKKPTTQPLPWDFGTIYVKFLTGRLHRSASEKIFKMKECVAEHLSVWHMMTKAGPLLNIKKK